MLLCKKLLNLLNFESCVQLPWQTKWFLVPYMTHEPDAPHPGLYKRDAGYSNQGNKTVFPVKSPLGQAINI